MPTLQDLVENYGLSQTFGVEGPFGGGHTGVDLLTPAGTPVPALGWGTIESVFSDTIGGQQVKVKYASGAVGWFAHLQEIYASIGERVDASTIIGKSGATGHVTGPHLHFEERDPSGQLVDPLSDYARSFVFDMLPSAPTTSDPDCPNGWSKGIFGVCEPFNPGKAPTGPVDNVVKGASDAIGGAVSGVPNAIAKVGDDLARGTKQLAIAGVIIGVVVVLGYSGVRQTLSGGGD